MVRVLIGLALVAALGGCGPVQPTPTSSTSATVPSATPIQSGEWTVLELPDAFDPWRAAGVIADADGLVIYGFVNGRPAAWTSPDGESWTTVALPGGEDGLPAGAARSEAATVLIGHIGTSRCAHPSGEILWRRLRGEETWQLVPFDENLFCAGGSALIAARPDGFMVAGMGTGDQPFAWRSDDGLAWANAAAGLPQDLPPWALAATSDGFLELGRGERTDARVSDGRSAWVPVAAPPAPPAFGDAVPGMDPAALIDTKTGLLAIYTGETGAAAWRRDAAGDWVDVDLPPDTEISGGVEIDGGPYLFASSGGRAALFTPADLASWRQIPIPEVDRILGLAVFEGRAILVTATTDADGETETTTVYSADQLAPGS